MRRAVAALLMVTTILPAACSHDALNGPALDLSSSDRGGGGGGDGGANGSGGDGGGATGGRDLSGSPIDFADPACIGTPQPANPVMGTLRGAPFVARSALGLWRFGDGCQETAIVDLFEGPVPADGNILKVARLWFEESRDVAGDLGATRPVDVYWQPHPNVDVTFTNGTVEWLRRDPPGRPGGVLEGILTVNQPGWTLSGRFVSEHCSPLDEICL